VQCTLARIEGDDPRRPDLARRDEQLLEAHKAESVKEVPAWAAKAAEFRRGFVAAVGRAALDGGRGRCRAVAAAKGDGEGVDGPARGVDPLPAAHTEAAGREAQERLIFLDRRPQRVTRGGQP
jgi:hypothetical protein